MVKLTVTVEAPDLGDALNFVKSWADDVSHVAYYGCTPVKAEWKSASTCGATSLQAWMEEA